MYRDFLEMLGYVVLFLLLLGVVTLGSALVAQPIMWAMKRIRLAAAEIAVAEAQAQAAKREATLVRPDALNGLLPVLPEQLPELAQAIAQIHYQHQVSKQAGLSSLTYSPRVQVKNDSAGLLPEQSSAPAFVVPSFAELLYRGSLGNGRFLLGCDRDTGQAVTGTWAELYSTALGGLPGSGKSTTARFLLAQAALNGCQFAVLDPHADAGDESLASTLALLSGAMLCEPASTDKAILDTVRYVAGLGKRRLAGTDTSKTPILLAIDEATALFARSTVKDELCALVEMVAQEFRKVGIFALVSGQIWKSDRVGNSALRDSFASAYVHHMKPQQARLLIPTEDARLAQDLQTGQAILYRTSGLAQVVCVPDTKQRDIELVAKHIDTPKGQARTVYALPDSGAESGAKSGTETGTNGSHAPEFEPGRVPASVPEFEPLRVDTIVDSARMAQVRQLLAQKVGINEIIRQVWGVHDKGGAWKKAHTELVDTIARIAQG